jgi:hypothetical protein
MYGKITDTTISISDRLAGAVADLDARKPGLKDRLAPALKLASKELELMQPAVIGATRKGLVAGLATTVRRGMWPIVLANPRKVLTMAFAPTTAGAPLRGFMDDTAELAAEVLGHRVAEKEATRAIDMIVEAHGARPGQPAPHEISERVVAQIFGVLFAPLSGDMRAATCELVETCLTADVCPLCVGLAGDGSGEGRFSAAWPILMPLAPYADALMAAV